MDTKSNQGSQGQSLSQILKEKPSQQRVEDWGKKRDKATGQVQQPGQDPDEQEMPPLDPFREPEVDPSDMPDDLPDDQPKTDDEIKRDQASSRPM